MAPVRSLVFIAMLAAMAFLLMATLNVPVLPAAPYLRYDPSDAVGLVAAVTMGPAAAVAVVFLKDLLWLFLRARGPFGPAADFIAAATFVGVAGWVYHRRPLRAAPGGPRRDAAWLGLACVAGVTARVLIMIPANYAILYLQFGMPPARVTALLLPAIVPFNAIKGALNGALAVMLVSVLARRGMTQPAARR
ncbi:MAG: ECF transporter S component [Armatimonadetes bacterium]|nr:ECF transporter S component [Armatimonadota bacterium]